MADPRSDRDPRYALLEAATRKTSKQLESIVSIAKGAITNVESLRKHYGEFKTKADQLLEEAREHERLKRGYEDKITEQKTRLFGLTHTFVTEALRVGREG